VRTCFPGRTWVVDVEGIVAPLGPLGREILTLTAPGGATALALANFGGKVVVREIDHSALGLLGGVLLIESTRLTSGKRLGDGYAPGGLK
jgi:hypothetical protein